MMSTVPSVFGTSRNIPKSYVPRVSLVEQITKVLETDSHFVVWGERRQGKSTLVRQLLAEEDYCVIQCAYRQKRYDIYRMILREAGASVAVERKRKRARGIGARVSVLTGEMRTEFDTTEHDVDIDISNINDVLNMLASLAFSKVIVLEDFHYLRRSTQRNLIQDLKTVYEKSDLRVILVGVWADRGWLRSLPSDLGTPLRTIEVPRWNDHELMEVLTVGQEVLGVEIESSIAQSLVERAHESVGLLQDLAHAVCQEAEPASDHDAQISEAQYVECAVDRVLQSRVSWLSWYLQEFSRELEQGSRQPLRGIVHALLVADPEDLSTGLGVDALFQATMQLYPNEGSALSRSNVLYGLDRISGIHRNMRIGPVFGFDASGERLHVVDPLARLFLSVSNQASLVRLLPKEGNDTIAGQIIRKG